ncbi:MAG: hypothetical protein AAB459_02210 [Patescibacteria group bacterium]
MKNTGKIIKVNYLAIFLTTLWIGFSEFLRNQLLFNYIWIEHYKELGLNFASKPINGVIWMIWSAVFAVVIYKIYNKFNAKETFVLSWVIGFLMMWLVIGSLGVLPIKLLLFAIPLSFIEVFGAIFIYKKD